MRKAPALVAATALAAVVVAGTGETAASGTQELRDAAASPAAAPCKPGPRKVNGVKVVVFCGPAKASLRYATTRLNFQSGACARAKSGAWAINIGTATVAPAKPKFKYFGITIGKLRGDRTYKNVSVGFQWRGTYYGLTGASVTLKGKASRGTFTGRLDKGAHPNVSGSFSCR